MWNLLSVSSLVLYLQRDYNVFLHLGNVAVHTPSPHGRGSSPRTVLITGGAGFIGFHTALRLAKERETEVVVIDNFNSYYNVQLKKDRASMLLRNGRRGARVLILR